MIAVEGRRPAMQMSVTLSIVVLTFWLADAVRAEGAVRLLDCTISRICDSGGSCERGSGQVTFHMEPLDLDADGAGNYALSYEQIQADMEAKSYAGPFLWSVVGERHALLASSETEWLWHRLALDPEPHATIRFLTCSFLQ